VPYLPLFAWCRAELQQRVQQSLRDPALGDGVLQRLRDEFGADSLVASDNTIVLMFAGAVTCWLSGWCVGWLPCWLAGLLCNALLAFKQDWQGASIILYWQIMGSMWTLQATALFDTCNAVNKSIHMQSMC
jgi:hypothetical protein